MKYMRPFEQEFYTTRPTKLTKHFRINLLWQLYRFAALNIKMLIMVRKH